MKENKYVEISKGILQGIYESVAMYCTIGVVTLIALWYFGRLVIKCNSLGCMGVLQ